MDTAFFIASKVVWALIRPDSWIVLGICLTFLGVWRRRQRLALWAGIMTLVATIGISVLPIGDLLLRQLETRYPIAPKLTNIDGIVVLGGGEDAYLSARWDQVILGDGAERFTATLALARENPNARIVFTGGSGALRDVTSNNWSGASVAERFFAEQGVDPARITFERASRNTAENATLTAALIAPPPDETWVLITSAFHMPRSVDSFISAGWSSIIPWPVDFRSRDMGRGLGWDLTGNLINLNIAIRERVGLIAYRFLQR
ncbi:YdcF family protein [Oceaniovalibus sp. ACAM 378]|uniref:YdcF family protein n=1 Tax=Oceaniovalibus sp. ACAM 378 TaxID=2599923 RepID=UPI0011D42091|nr:YdcF family protein [Oceaniovalibus sp. ACAM 378]TYB85607.1 YdcF family protein [Oceaniovalibus sp. ACAM 378]